MSADQKIWFIYITDHHEGPFTPEEVAAKIAEGVVTPQSLGWKDGMAEWLAIESIPELSAALSGGAPLATESLSLAASTDPAPAEGDGVSLAQLLAGSQKGTNIANEIGVNTQGSNALASMMASSGSVPSGAEPAPTDEVWTLKVGTQVSGLYSLQRLIQLAGEGEIPSDAMLWHTGWTDFQPVHAVSAVATARKSKKNTSTGITRGGMTGSRSGIAPLTAAASFANEDKTDPGMEAPKKKSFFGLLDKLKNLVKKKPKGFNPAGAKAAPNKTAGKTSFSTGTKKKAVSMDGVKRVLGIILGLGVVAGLGAAYFIFFSSPIPSNLDVIPDDLEMMQALVKEPASQGGRFHVALARGTEENIPDDGNPKFYVATNLPKGTQVTLSIQGVPGTLVNKLRLEKSFSATVDNRQIAVFEQMQDDGKPLPMGEYKMKITAEGAAPFEKDRFLGGKKGGAYERRLKQYKDKLQADYDKETQELREFVGTLKTMHLDFSKHYMNFKAGWNNPAQKPKITYEWKTFMAGFAGMSSQLDQKVRERLLAAGDKYYPRAYQDISTNLTQLIQLADGLNKRILENAPATTNPDEQIAQIQIGITGLDQLIAQAVVKTPFDALSAAPATATPAAPAAPAVAAPVAAPAAAVPPPAAAPAAAPAVPAVQK